MRIKGGLLSKDFDNVNILNMLLYSVVIFMPFIVTTIAKPYYVSGKVVYLYLNILLIHQHLFLLTTIFL